MQPIRFRFDAEKAAQVILYLASQGKTLTLHSIFKIIYFAEKRHLQLYGRPILGDDYIKMPAGPVPSKTYDGLKALRGDLDVWPGPELEELIVALRPVLEVRRNHFIYPLISGTFAFDLLSDSERELLDESYRANAGKSFKRLMDESHDAAWEGARESGRIKYESIIALFDPDKKLIRHLRDTMEAEELLESC